MSLCKLGETLGAVTACETTPTVSAVTPEGQDENPVKPGCPSALKPSNPLWRKLDEVRAESD